MLAFLLAFAANAEEPYVPPAPERLWYTSATFVRVNPLGAIEVARLGWRHRLSAGDGILVRDTYTWAAASVMASPAFARGGVYLEAQPLAILRVSADVSGVQYFGGFDQLASWDDPTVRYSDQTLDAGVEHAPTSGWVATFGGTLQAKVGPIAVRNTTQLARFDLALPDGDLYFYDQVWDRLVADERFQVQDDLDVMFVQGGLRAGGRYTFTDGLDGRDGGTDGGLAHHRLGPIVAVQLVDHPGEPRFDQPTVFVLAQWWLRHPYRTGEEQPAALPLVAVGFQFNGDAVPSAR